MREAAAHKFATRHFVGNRDGGADRRRDHHALVMFAAGDVRQIFPTFLAYG